MNIDFARAHNDYLDPDRHLHAEEEAESITSPEDEALLLAFEQDAERHADEAKALGSAEGLCPMCPDCGAELEWEDSDSEIGRPGLWWCPECEA